MFPGPTEAQVIFTFMNFSLRLKTASESGLFLVISQMKLFILLSHYLFFFFVFVYLSHHGNHASECAETRNTDIMTRYKKLHISETTVQSSKSGQRERTPPRARSGGKPVG